ncbi:MAG: NADH-quinone oxidoreductase subunit [Frankiaceae bacterium]|jgi:NADH-quinone oxidoreductase subunit J|nr:NADH-quinone oxidoreductase subunit [Frankiaceae bacterium]
MTGADVVFALLGVVCLAAAVLVVTSPNVIHAALWLVVCFGALAGCYLVLTAEFVAWVQVLIYIGAIVVLMLFGAMLTRAPIGPQPAGGAGGLDSGNRPLAALAGLATTGVLGTLVISAFRGAYVDIHHTAVGDGRVIGAAVFRFFVLPFEIASVLLLAALVGAIVLTRREVSDAEQADRA